MTQASAKPIVRHPYDLPPKLARRLVHGEIVPADADLILKQGAAVAVAAQRHVPDPPDTAWVMKILRHLLDQWLKKFADDRALVGHRIKGCVWRLAEQRAAANVIYAEAHDINAAADFPFAEREVKAAVDSILHHIMRGGR